ncbi:hypothetical protein niasHS_009459 [Heterodera schachtii]|uniref:Regulatory protein zeste n=1 Tax=Heterodera schachtii TaxID=97005 RepID=A0ABD2J795_HETSC
MALFNKQQGAEIAKFVEEHYDEFFPDNKTANAVQRSRAAWQHLANDLNSRHSGANFSWTQIKDKYKNLKKDVKRQYADEKKYKSGTGGGPAFAPSTDPDDISTKEAILATFGNSASFQGVPGGVSTNMFGGSPLMKTLEEEEENIEVKAIFESRKTATPRSRRTESANAAGCSSMSMSELQRQVLLVELENQRKLSPLLDKVSEFVDRASPLIDKMSMYMDQAGTSHAYDYQQQQREFDQQQQQREFDQQQENEEFFVEKSDKTYRKL